MPGFQKSTFTAYRTLESAGQDVLRAIALYLDLPENYFDDKVKHGNSILRPIHYFPIEDPDAVPADAVRAAEHGDINLITLLMGASADGLQVKRRDGKWIAITALPDQIVVNVGDMLQRLTNGVLKSTIHRVVNPRPRKNEHLALQHSVLHAPALRNEPGRPGALRNARQPQEGSRHHGRRVPERAPD